MVDVTPNLCLFRLGMYSEPPLRFRTFSGEELCVDPTSVDREEPGVGCDSEVDALLLPVRWRRTWRIRDFTIGDQSQVRVPVV